MLEHLSNPEYFHVLINPLPVYGLAVGFLSLVLALLARARTARVIALAIVFVAAISAWPTFHYGEAAKDRVLAMSDRDGGKWIEEHEARAEKLIYIFYAVAALSAAALALEKFRPRFALPLSMLTALVAVAALGAGAYIGAAGGRIRHKEYRYVPPPEQAETDRD
jgi:glucan phosphoethanolaminetransferase (alkaline phosphatase superfamily)